MFCLKLTDWLDKTFQKKENECRLFKLDEPKILAQTGQQYDHIAITHFWTHIPHADGIADARGVGIYFCSGYKARGMCDYAVTSCYIGPFNFYISEKRVDNKCATHYEHHIPVSLHRFYGLWRTSHMVENLLEEIIGRKGVPAPNDHHLMEEHPLKITIRKLDDEDGPAPDAPGWVR